MVYLYRHSSNLLYPTLVRPQLEYGNVVWSPFLKSNITLIENVQRRATRYVPDTNKIDYQEELTYTSVQKISRRHDYNVQNHLFTF